MNDQRPINRYRLYMHRTLTDNVNMVFDFVRDNWRLWLKMMIYFLLPFSVPLGTVFAAFYNEGDIFAIESISDMTLVVYLILSVTGCAVVTAMMILLVKWHESHNCTLDECNVSAMWRMLPKASLKCLGIIVISDILIGLSVLLIVFLIGIGALLALLPVFLLCPIMLLEPEGSFSSLVHRAFSLGYKKWGALILIAGVMGVVAIIMNNAVSFPLSLFLMLRSLLEESAGDTMFWSLLMDIVFYIMCVVQSFIVFVAMGLFVLAMTYHYGSVAAEVEDIGLESDIDNFAHL